MVIRIKILLKYLCGVLIDFWMGKQMDLLTVVFQREAINFWVSLCHTATPITNWLAFNFVRMNCF